jgi:hypothetical protein
MKKNLIFKILLHFLALSTLLSCKDELVTIEGGKDLPVVYGLLSLADTATYIRVEKAYSDPNKNAFEVAQIPDSLYYNDAKVFLIRNKNNERFELAQVDGNTEGYPRKEGIFAKSPNKVYKIKTSLLAMQRDEEWRIEVTRQGKTIAKELVTTVGNYVLFAPTNKTLFLRNENQFAVSIQTDEEEQSGRIYEANVILNIDETLNNATQTKKYVWKYATFDNRTKSSSNKFTSVIDFQRRGREFYEYLGNNVPVVAGISRSLKSIDIEVLIGSQEFIDYRTRFNSNSGITGSQTILNYTNKGGTLGFVASRNRVVSTDFKISNETLETIKNDALTKGLGFR